MDYTLFTQGPVYRLPSRQHDDLTRGLSDLIEV